MKFTEAKLEQAIIELLEQEGYPHVAGRDIDREPSEVLIKEDLKSFLANRYADDKITASEIDSIIRRLELLSASDLYESNKVIMQMLSDGFLFKREDRSQKDIHINLIDYGGELIEDESADETSDSSVLFFEDIFPECRMPENIYKLVNQLEIDGYEKCIPDAILYINGLPLVVFEFKSAIREEATIHNAYIQITTRYKRDIPELFKYNAFCIISDGVNSKMGSLFAPYEFYYAWRRTRFFENGVSCEKDDGGDTDGINSLYTLLKGLFNEFTLLDVINNFIYMPDSSNKEEKILCRYPQYYAANKLYGNIADNCRPHGDGKGGTYFGATGCGKSFTMLFLTRLLMRSLDFSSPTIILITDRTDLDDQLAGVFVNAKQFIGDSAIVSVESRQHLRELLAGHESGGVFLTTIHKFTEDAKLLTNRSNVICISDEAHRSQINLEQKITMTEQGVKRTYGFAKYLHESLPNATYVGFTGTPIDATLDVFGEVVDFYTMTESVKDEITVKIVYEGRAAKVLLDNGKLKDIEDYYSECISEGASDYQVDQSKKATTQMNSILGDPDRIEAIAKDFVEHYETRVTENATVKGKAMFVCSNRAIAYDFYQAVIALRPDWAEVKVCADGIELSEQERKTIKPIEQIKMIMTRSKDDPPALYKILGTKEYRKELDRQFKNEKSNFKIAIVVDMWLTGFDIPFLDTIYIDKPIKRHSLIQTISRVNRRFETKQKGLVVDYIGIKKQMNLALAHYSKTDSSNFEGIEQSIVVVKDHLELLRKLFHEFNLRPYFDGSPLEQLHCLNLGAEFVQITDKIEKRFMYLVKRLKAAYDICCGSDAFVQRERDYIHFYLAVRSIVVKLTKGDAPDSAQMNARVREMIKAALHSDGVEELFKLGDEQTSEIDIFDDDYLAKIDKIKLPNTKLKILQQMLARAIDDFKKINKIKGLDFSKQLKAIVDKYNERKERDIWNSEELEEISQEIIELIAALNKEQQSFSELNISLEEKSFYDILKALAHKYDFEYPEDKLLLLAKAVKKVVDDKSQYTAWSQREDIKAELKVDLIMLLADHGYPPVDRDEVYKEIFEQAENFKKYHDHIQ